MIRAYYCIVIRAVRKNRLDDYFVIYPLEGEIGNLNHAKSGIEMKIFTDQPGLVVFTPLHFDGICFETQKFSNTPNISGFPSTLIKSGKRYFERTQFEFNLKT
jgi:aldose 1-epimerase